jgi:hypothetical protein
VIELIIFEIHLTIMKAVKLIDFFNFSTEHRKGQEIHKMIQETVMLSCINSLVFIVESCIIEESNVKK